MSEFQPEDMDKQIDDAEIARRETVIRLLMRDATPIIDRLDGEDAVQAETVIKSLLERAYAAGEEHAFTLPKTVAHEPKHRKDDEQGGSDE